MYSRKKISCIVHTLTQVLVPPFVNEKGRLGSAVGGEEGIRVALTATSSNHQA